MIVIRHMRLFYDFIKTFMGNYAKSQSQRHKTSQRQKSRHISGSPLLFGNLLFIVSFFFKIYIIFYKLFLFNLV